MDTSGLREIGITMTFLPNRSIYLGDNLILRVNEAETNLQIYDLSIRQTSSYINVYSEALTYDYWPIDSGDKRWFIAACQTD